MSEKRSKKKAAQPLWETYKKKKTPDLTRGGKPDDIAHFSIPSVFAELVILRF